MAHPKGKVGTSLQRERVKKPKPVGKIIRSDKVGECVVCHKTYNWGEKVFTYFDLPGSSRHFKCKAFSWEKVRR